MSLRHKLLTIFGALALISLVTAGVTFWTITQWRATNRELEGHYQRSLLLQRVRAATFRAFKEVPDAVTGDDQDSRQEFAEYIRPAEEDFAKWSELANTDEERQEVRQLREKFDVLVRNAGRAFDLVEAGRMREAFVFMEGQLEDNNFAPFQEATEQAVASDQRKREVISARVQGTRRSALIVLSIAAFGALSLILLLAAYLASDLFKPLREVEAALTDTARGDVGRRLDEERSDEIGAINKAFNRLVEAVVFRERTTGRQTLVADGSLENASLGDATIPRVTAHTLVARLRELMLRLRNGAGVGDSAEARQTLAEEIEQLAQAVAYVTELGFPLDVKLARTDVRTLLYEVLLRFHDEFAELTVGLEFDVAPEVDYAMVDRPRLRQVIGELVRNALEALPRKGGRLGVRARLAEDGTELVIEVADNGKGPDEQPTDRARAGTPTGLQLSKAIVEQHGGSLEVKNVSGEGAHAAIRLPLRR